MNNSNSNAATAANAVRELVMIRPRISVWSGQASVRRDTDLGTVAGELPSRAVMSDGVKKLIPNERLAPLKSIRTGLPRQLLRLGFDPMESGEEDGRRCGSGIIAVAKSYLTEAMDLLNAAKQSFTEYRDDVLIPNLGQFYREQEEKLEGDDKAFLQRNQRTPEQVRAACHLNWSIFTIAPAEGEQGEGEFQDIVAGMVPALVSEIARDADQLYNGSFLGRQVVGQRAVGAVRRLSEKMEIYSMIEGRLLRASIALERMLRMVPTSGPLDTHGTMMLGAVLALCTSPERLLKLGENAAIDTIADDDNNSEGYQPSLNMGEDE